MASCIARQVSTREKNQRYTSPSAFSGHETSTVAIASSQPTATVNTTVSADGFSRSISFAVIRPARPSLHVDDPSLQALPGTCAGYQSTRLRAVSDGADVSRLLAFVVTNSSVLTVDHSIPSHPMVRGLAPGTAQIYVRDEAWSSVTVTVTDALVALNGLSAGVVSGVEWAAVSSAAGPFVPVASQTFTSETSKGWVYVTASFDDGTTQPIEDGVSASVAAPSNASLAVAHPDAQPPEVSVRAGATSLCTPIEVTTCLGIAYALVNLTLPPPTDVQLTSVGNRYTLSPAGGVAEQMGSRRSYADLVATVAFADGATRAMQMDSRVSFSASSSCGAFVAAGAYMRLTATSSCRDSELTVTARATIGGVTVVTSMAFDVEWLAAVSSSSV